MDTEELFPEQQTPAAQVSQKNGNDHEREKKKTFVCVLRMQKRAFLPFRQEEQRKGQGITNKETWRNI